MKLYYSPGACSLAPHVALRELGLAFELEQVDLKSKQTASGQDFRRVNPKGYVPALELDDGFVLTEAPAILQYVADRMPEKRLVPAWGTLDRYQVQAWLNFVSSEVHKPFSALFGALPEDQRRAQRTRISTRLDWVETELTGRMWLVANSYTVADIYLFVITNWCDKFGIDTSRWPNLLAWRARIAERPAVKMSQVAESMLVPEKV